MTARREFDITLFGATGFTGRLTAGHLATHGADARIALAGRSMARLAAVRESLGPQASQWELVTADSSEPKALQAMAERTRLVVSTVGPYTLHGMPLVGACADTGTDYADLTAEPGFVRESIRRHRDVAARTGARIVHSCGFDAIPSDLGVYALHRRASADGAGPLTDTTFVAREAATSMSGGTLASAVALFREASRNPELRRSLGDPYTLTVDRGAEPDLGRQPDLVWRRGGDNPTPKKQQQKK